MITKQNVKIGVAVVFAIAPRFFNEYFWADIKCAWNELFALVIFFWFAWDYFIQELEHRHLLLTWAALTIFCLQAISFSCGIQESIIRLSNPDYTETQLWAAVSEIYDFGWAMYLLPIGTMGIAYFFTYVNWYTIWRKHRTQ